MLVKQKNHVFHDEKKELIDLCDAYGKASMHTQEKLKLLAEVVEKLEILLMEHGSTNHQNNRLSLIKSNVRYMVSFLKSMEEFILSVKNPSIYQQGGRKNEYR